MTKREIASLAIKLMGIFILLKSISYAPMIFGSVFSGVYRSEEWGLLLTVFYVFIAIISLVWGLFIIVLSDKVAAWLIKEDDDKVVEASGSINKDDVMLVVFSCIGLFIIVTGFPNLMLHLSQFFTVRRAGSDSAAYFSGGTYKALRLVAPVVQIALGVWLFAGAKGLVKFWKKIRS